VKKAEWCGEILMFRRNILTVEELSLSTASADIFHCFSFDLLKNMMLLYNPDDWDF
jgi:hypothetical protein